LNISYNYGGWLRTPLCVVLALATAGQSVKRCVVGLSSCPVANDVRQTARCVVAMSHCCSIQIKGLAYKASDSATSRRTTTRRLVCCAKEKTTARQRAVWRFVLLSLATRRTGDNDIGCVVAIDNATRNVPHQPPY
jgi:hypothetical protein